MIDQSEIQNLKQAITLFETAIELLKDVKDKSTKMACKTCIQLGLEMLKINTVDNHK